MLLNDLKKQYLDSGEMDALLAGHDISMISDFLDNWNVMKEFQQSFYADGLPKTVLCGINPGRHGAGKTGIPFIDFASLSQMMPAVNRQDSERSATFFYDIVNTIGAEVFYRTFYVTNVSWLGYTHNNMNVNYDQLPEAAKAFVYEKFKYEMSVVSPTTIISLGGVVKETIDELFGDTNIETGKHLPHPNYCAFPRNYEHCKSRYLDMLLRFVG